MVWATEYTQNVLLWIQIQIRHFCNKKTQVLEKVFSHSAQTTPSLNEKDVLVLINRKKIVWIFFSAIGTIGLENLEIARSWLQFQVRENTAYIFSTL